MKKIALILSICLLAAISSHGQYRHHYKHKSGRSYKHNKETFESGLKAGLNITGIIPVDDIEASFRLGFHAGGFVKVPLNKSLAFRPELLFTQKGASTIVEVWGLTATSKNTISYIEVPLLMQYKIADAVNIQAGPYLSYMVGMKIKDNDEEISLADYNRFDYGIALGSTFNLGDFELGARYSLGLPIIGKDKTVLNLTVNTYNARNSVISISAGYRF